MKNVDIIAEFLEATPSWLKEFDESWPEDEPCKLCGIKRENLRKLMEALAPNKL